METITSIAINAGGTGYEELEKQYKLQEQH